MNTKKPKPNNGIYTIYWWNPLVYIAILAAFICYLWDGGIKEWWKEVKDLIQNYDWS